MEPGAFARYRWREQLFPTLTFRRAYDALCQWRGQHSADVNYLRILQLAATTMEADVDEALSNLLDQGKRFDCQDVADLVAPRTPAIPALSSLPSGTNEGEPANNGKQSLIIKLGHRWFLDEVSEVTP